jgi:hypothetical protein
MLSAGFEPTIPAIDRQQTYALDSTATENSGFFVGSEDNVGIILLLHVQI